jgi:hypothetical protein
MDGTVAAPVADRKQAEASHEPGHQSFWLWVMCLTGVDYFSTLGYIPSIAFEATGRLAPFATLLLVMLTLGGALPVFCYVAGRSAHGQGSIAMLERLVRGWGGKGFVLVLLGFAATDFIITMTLSAADAAEHLIHNPLWDLAPGALHSQLVVTFGLLTVLGAIFMRGFREVIWLAVGIVGVYLFLNAIVIGVGLEYLATHPSKLSDWWTAVTAADGDWHLEGSEWFGRGWGAIILLCLVFFPKLALGMSGFETGLMVMPLVKGSPDDDPRHPAGRIRNTRKLLATAALIMSVYLLGSSLVTSTLINPVELREGGKAANRALAYLAHGQKSESLESSPQERARYEPIPPFSYPVVGTVFGTVYDISTVVILWFAGASAMAGLLNLVPQYLPRYGMAPDWARAVRPLVILFTVLALVVTWIFNASVTAQSAAYATGVLVLLCSACVAVVISKVREGARKLGVLAFGLIALVFIYTTVAVIIEKPDGIKIASFFIAAIILASLISRTSRSTELRFIGFEFDGPESRFLWESIKHLEWQVLVPHRPGGRDLASKERSIREEHRIGPEVPVIFIEVTVGDPSEFYQAPQMQVTQQEGRIVIRLSRVASIPHVLAAIGLELAKTGKPPEFHFGWSDESPLAVNVGFLLFGEGNVPWMVRELVIKAQPDPARQPRILIG